jgi:hypothetical protein
MAASGLSRETELRLAPEVRLTIARDELVIDAGHGEVRLHASLLEVVQAFQTPTTIDGALASLRTVTALDWMELSADIVRLHHVGVLVSEIPAAPARRSRGFGSARLHVSMLDDAERTGAFVAAIRDVVKPGDVVVDLGTGTGVLAVAAAQAGARHVYAIERSGIAEMAQKTFEANGVSDRVTLLREVSTRVELSERADVMVSEIIGNGGFDEQILTYTRDALARLLVSSPRMVPSSLRLLARPVTVDRDLVLEHTFDPAATSRWSAAYGIDFSALSAERRPEPFEAMVDPDRARSFAALGEAIEIVQVDLARPPAAIEADFELVANRDGCVNAVVVEFEIDLGAERRVVSDPWADHGATSWGIPVWLLPVPLMVVAGDTLTARYRFAGTRASLEIG